MVIVAKSKSDYEIKRQKIIDNLNLKAKNRKNYIKAKKILKETGTSMYQASDNRTTLERLQDIQNLDENLEMLLLKNLGANSGNSKQFLSKLDDNLKEFLLSRFPQFKDIFSKSFLIPNAQNLRMAFDLFNKKQIEKSKNVDVPTEEVVRDYINGLDDSSKILMSKLIIQQLKKRGIYDIDERLIDPNDIFNFIDEFVGFFDNDIDAYTSLYATVRGNFRDFPKLSISQDREGIPSNTWNVRPSRVKQIYEDRQNKTQGSEKLEEKTNIPTVQATTFETTQGVQRYKNLIKLKKTELEQLVDDYNKLPTTIFKIKKKIGKRIVSKKELVLELIRKGSNISGTQFNEKDELLQPQLNKLKEYLNDNYLNWEGTAGVSELEQKDPGRDLSLLEGFGMSKGIIFLR